MLEQEAIWFNKKVSSIDVSKIGKMLNVGSSTYIFRSFYQPYIEKEIFGPLSARGVSIEHLDIKDEEGVDIVGNIDDSDFVTFLENQKFGSVFCSNFLEHVVDRSIIFSALDRLVPSGGLLFLSVPYLYPYHRDPIDSLYRPDPAALAMSFPNFSISEQDIVVDRFLTFFSEYI